MYPYPARLPIGVNEPEYIIELAELIFTALVRTLLVLGIVVAVIFTTPPLETVTPPTVVLPPRAVRLIAPPTPAYPAPASRVIKPLFPFDAFSSIFVVSPTFAPLSA